LNTDKNLQRAVMNVTSSVSGNDVVDINDNEDDGISYVDLDTISISVSI